MVLSETGAQNGNPQPILVAQVHQRTLLALGFCLAIAAVFFFGYRAGHTARHVRWQEEAIQPWMSVPFIAHTRHTPEKPLFEAIHVQPDRHDRRPIRDIARAGNVPVAELIRDLEQAIAKASGPGSGSVSPPGKTISPQDQSGR